MKLINRLFLSAAFAVISSTISFGQIPAGSICLGGDTTVCAGQPVTILDCGNVGGTFGSPSAADYVVTTIPYGPDPLTAGTSVSLSDDSQTGLITLPFTFCFYGNSYTQIIIGSNNFVTFSAGGSSTWVTTAIPNAGFVPKNAIMGPWQDINPGIGGTIKYATYGTAPFRRFSVSWQNVPMFSCTGQLYSSQVIIYETSNNIETHIQNKTVCTTWNSGNAVHGLHNITGTAAVVVPGRNNTQWSATSEGVRFTPGSIGVQWGNTLGASFPYNNGSLSVTSPPVGTTGYFLKAACSGTGSISDTTFITNSVPTVTATSVSDTCGLGVGTVSATSGAGISPFTFNWPTIPGGNTATVNNVSTGTYAVTMTDAGGCTATTAVAVQNVSVTSSGTTTLVSCAGGNDGTATATMTPSSANMTYLWDDPAAQTTQTAVGLTAGVYNCTVTNDLGCVELVTVTVTEIPGMVATIANQIDVDCHAANTGIINLNVIDGTAPYSYVWSGSTSTGMNATDLFVGNQSVDVTDANGCLVTLNTVLAEPPALYIDSVSTDSIICSESSIILGAVGAGGSTPYIYTWFENGTQISNSQYVSVDPVNSGTQYVVVLSEVCGSPTDSDSLVLTFPQDIIPLATPVPFEACAPDTFQFLNVSTNGADIATTVWEFSNGTTITVPGQNSVKDYFEFAGMYDADMTVTSTYGCVYTNSFPQIISALQRPTAQFGMTTNPTTIFETSVGMIDKSIDASQWSWMVPEATPMTSNDQFPVFNFPHVEGNYEVILLITSPKGCTDTTRAVLEVQNDFILYAPNSFTPDGDQFNQNWHIVTEGLDFNDYELKVFNRWGEVIWESRDPEAEWDGTYAGKIVPQGSYNWKLRTKKIGTDDPQIFTGSVMIIR